MPRKSTLKLSRRVVEALAVERGDRVFYDRDLTGFGDVPDLCHIPPILPILQNHTNRRTPTNLPALPKRRALPNRHPVRGGAKHPFETKTRVPKRSAALGRQKSPHRTTLRFAWDCPDIARKPRRAWRLRVPGVSDERPNLPKPKPPTPQSPCLQPRRSPRPGPRTLPRARFANRGGACSSLYMGWKSGQGFWRLERSEIKQKSVRHVYATNPFGFVAAGYGARQHGHFFV